MDEETREIFVRKPVQKPSKVYRAYIRGTRASTNRFPRSPMATWMCDRSQRLRRMSSTRNLLAVAQARLFATVNLREEWLCKESADTPEPPLCSRDFLNARPDEFLVARNTRTV
ncbi:unnamed protein product [Lasius platythorax]|uniref:Uncharacterized protein n=1 Tax=Lasius platythorax TaxID=488582 RepID=A0AAV2NCB4_9HYME